MFVLTDKFQGLRTTEDIQIPGPKMDIIYMLDPLRVNSLTRTITNIAHFRNGSQSILQKIWAIKDTETNHSEDGTSNSRVYVHFISNITISFKKINAGGFFLKLGLAS